MRILPFLLVTSMILAPIAAHAGSDGGGKDEDPPSDIITDKLAPAPWSDPDYHKLPPKERRDRFDEWSRNRDRVEQSIGEAFGQALMGN